MDKNCLHTIILLGDFEVNFTLISNILGAMAGLIVGIATIVGVYYGVKQFFTNKKKEEEKDAVLQAEKCVTHDKDIEVIFESIETIHNRLDKAEVDQLMTKLDAFDDRLLVVEQHEKIINEHNTKIGVLDHAVSEIKTYVGKIQESLNDIPQIIVKTIRDIRYERDNQSHASYQQPRSNQTRGKRRR